MKTGSCVLAAIAVLALPASRTEAQTTGGPPAGQTRTLSREPPHGRAPRWGFSVGMNPGPNNEYGYPYIRSVAAGTNAERSGLAVGDTILSVNGRDARQPPLFPVREAGTRYVLRVRRGREELELTYIYPRIEETPRRDGAGTSP